MHLSVLNATLQVSLHSTRLSITLCNDVQSLPDLIVREHLASSAIRASMREWDKVQGISLINKTNKAGPGSEPVGLLS